MAPFNRRGSQALRTPKRAIILEDAGEALNFVMAERRKYHQQRQQQYSKDSKQQMGKGGQGGRWGKGRGGRGGQGGNSRNPRPENGGVVRKSSPASQINAPTYDAQILIGDSIALRLARHLGLFAPKNMTLCRGGLTISQLTKNLKFPEINFNQRDVILMVGINDVLQGRKVSEDDIKGLLTTCRQKDAGSVFMFLLPPLHPDTKIGVGEINELIEKAGDPSENFYVVDGYSPFLDDAGNREEKFFERFYQKSSKLDLVHPNAEGLNKLKDLLQDFFSSLMTDS